MYEANGLAKRHSIDEFFTWNAEKGAYTVSNAEKLEKVWDKMSKSQIKDIAEKALAGFDTSISGLTGDFEKAKEALKTIADGGELTAKEWEEIEKYSKKTNSNFY
jgi:hypothetical protein